MEKKENIEKKYSEYNQSTILEIYKSHKETITQAEYRRQLTNNIYTVVCSVFLSLFITMISVFWNRIDLLWINFLIIIEAWVFFWWLIFKLWIPHLEYLKNINNCKWELIDEMEEILEYELNKKENEKIEKFKKEKGENGWGSNLEKKVPWFLFGAFSIFASTFLIIISIATCA